MKKKTALISWIGDADLVEFYHDDLLPSNLKEQFINNLPKDKNRDNFKNKHYYPIGGIDSFLLVSLMIS